MDSADRMVLITGATGRLGRVATRAFAADGARLALAGMEEARLHELANEVGLSDDRWTPVVADLRDPAAAGAALSVAADRLGPRGPRPTRSSPRSGS